ncbi:MAG: 6,7-dimethyl-8-ribityllumazine synthase [Deltaproteobacteria bacterium]|uniref:6,7-dimethyl-8-ribityllumazine synthase n=1 Tax=Candidatus Zymogenus saltonus TaxID=2844893 RepID=A0A9D8KHG9_9DELT|nr:6,7-dimethyl-8-ribityllumazine synthase [Candidatus Zymogenus saltonus]
MPRHIEGKIEAKGLKFGVILSRFNSFIGDKLLDGATDAILRHGGADEDIHVYRVPGAFEVPQMARKLVELGKYDAIICIGAVIRGSTPHFEYIAAESAKGVARLSMESNIPVSYGIITTDNIEQAIERAGSKSGNKGYDAAVTAIEMVNLMAEIKK